jgi:dTDP-4-amino-4,6-dideoxygalactose transaminase
MTAADSLPALLGGPPVRPQGPPDWPPADEAVREALLAAWRDGSWGKYHGGHVRRLEGRLAADYGAEYALTCGSGTFAVELALRALKVAPGDEVVLAAYDYPGNFLAVHAVGATPVLVDLDAENWNLSAERLAEALGPATRAVIASHLHGGLVPMREVTALAAAKGVRVVEDAAQAPGATVQGRPAGAWGDLGVLSFGGSKLLSAGRGGAVLTRHADVHQRARLHLHRGNAVCPLSELQAAVLLPQLAALPSRHTARLRAARRLVERLGEMPGLRPFRNRADGEPAYYKVGLQFDAARFGLARERLVAAVRAEGVALDEGFRALHVGRSPGRLRRASTLTEAERAGAGAVVLHHPVLLGSDEDVEQVALALEKVHAHAGRLA